MCVFPDGTKQSDEKLEIWVVEVSEERGREKGSGY
jgi:hypothetical protein